MKTMFSLALLSAGMAFAQNPDLFRRGDRDARFAGRYEAFQRDDTIRRTLSLDNNGRAELTTEIRRARGRNDRGRWDGDDTKSYGTLADDASDRPIRHTGRWREDGGRVFLTLTDRSDVRGGESRAELKLMRREAGLVFDTDQKLYGRAKIEFRRDGRWDGGRPTQRPRWGTMRYDNDGWDIDGIELVDRGRDSRLVIRAANRRIELRGEAQRRGDRVTFRLPDDDRTGGGEFALRMRGNVVDSIEGRGYQDRHRIDIREGNRRD